MEADAQEVDAARDSTGRALSVHPAWMLLAQDDALAWRRAACRELDAMAASERAEGGLLKLLQSEASPQRLAVPAGTRGALNAYVHSTAELSAVVRSYLAATRDTFCQSHFSRHGHCDCLCPAFSLYAGCRIVATLSAPTNAVACATQILTARRRLSTTEGRAVRNSCGGEGTALDGR